MNISGFPGYEVSPDGVVRSLASGRAIAQQVLPNGYAKVALWRHGKGHTRYIHRLVAAAYLPADTARLHVNHINGDKLDNRPENLEWCTPRENSRHAVRIGRIRVGAASHKAKMRDDQAAEALRLWNETPRQFTQKQLGRRYGVSGGCIQRLVERKSWRHLDQRETAHGSV